MWRQNCFVLVSACKFSPIPAEKGCVFALPAILQDFSNIEPKPQSHSKEIRCNFRAIVDLFRYDWTLIASIIKL